ncbi:MAG: hypothetical protein D6793_02050 [Thermoflexia bacterium]|nr:MAG: hypothetical protein D6793_02050 [Thermoflexia bacterium]
MRGTVSRVMRWPLPVAAGAMLFALSERILTSPSLIRLDDFVEYGAAGRLSLTGGNPYALAQVLRLERAAGRPVEEAVMLWKFSTPRWRGKSGKSPVPHPGG